jgi:signal peptidase I
MPYYIPSASMEPTLHGCQGCNNDRVLVDKLAYHLHDVHRGDVIVFDRPSTWRNISEKTLIKRVIGLPGETLTESGGTVYVDGKRLSEPYVNKACKQGTSFPQKSYTVPKDDVFVMGDNRCFSDDSRMQTAVPEDDIVGRAFVIIWPLGRIHYI